MALVFAHKDCFGITNTSLLQVVLQPKVTLTSQQHSKCMNNVAGSGLAAEKAKITALRRKNGNEIAVDEATARLARGRPSAGHKGAKFSRINALLPIRGPPREVFFEAPSVRRLCVAGNVASLVWILE